MKRLSASPPAPHDRMRVYRHAILVSAEALDENGHANNVQYVQWMQDAATSHSESVGCTRATRAAGAIWVARSHAVEYLRPAFLGDRLTVLTWVSDRRRVRSLRRYKFVRDADGAVLARGETDWVFVDVASGKPRQIPEAVMSGFTPVPPGEEP